MTTVRRALHPLLPATTAALVLLVLAGCGWGGASDSVSGDADASTGGDTRLALVAYSTPQLVYDEINPAYQRTEDGKDVSFRTSFGASGDQSRAVEEGLPADVVSFSIEPDMERLVNAGIVDGGWRDKPSGGLVSTSVVTFVVRRGNPKGITDWDDLIKPGIEVLTPSPFTSGSAKWNLLAAYGQASDAGKDAQAGLDYVRTLLEENVKVQDKSAREALQSFISGNGDVLLSYENEAVTAQKKGQDVDYVVPDRTIRIEIPVAVTKTAESAAAARAYLDHLLSKPAQQMFADWGYRPVNPFVLRENASKFPEPPGLFTVRDLGGWPKVNDELFDPDSGEIAKIENDRGGAAER